MQTEDRGGPLGSPGYAYSLSTYQTKTARYVATDFGGESVASPPVLYGLPSIQRVTVDAVAGAFDIAGTFPATKGSVTFAGAQGATTISPSSWTTTSIVAPLPSGLSTGGLVSVTSQGISSNAVPITAWSGQLTFSAQGSTTQWDGDAGTGTYTLGGTFNVTMLGDVHPYVSTVDTAPVAQAFTAAAVAPGSNGALTSGSGTFASSGAPSNGCQSCSISLALASPQPTMVPSASSANAFFIVNEAAPPSSSPVPVPSPGPGCGSNANTMCAFLSFSVDDPVTCAVTGGAAPYCADIGGPLSDVGQTSGSPVYFLPSFTLTMDPSSYALTFASSTASYAFDPFGTPGNGTTTMTGSFQVQSAPTPQTPAGRRSR